MTISFAVNFPLFFMLVICLSYVSDGGMYSVSPAICINSFGMKNGAGIYAMVYCSYIFGNFS